MSQGNKRRKDNKSAVYFMAIIFALWTLPFLLQVCVKFADTQVRFVIMITGILYSWLVLIVMKKRLPTQTFLETRERSFENHGYWRRKLGVCIAVAMVGISPIIFILMFIGLDKLLAKP